MAFVMDLMLLSKKTFDSARMKLVVAFWNVSASDSSLLLVAKKTSLHLVKETDSDVVKMPARMMQVTEQRPSGLTCMCVTRSPNHWLLCLRLFRYAA